MFALLHALSDGRFHSGEVLAQTLGCSRSHVWQQIQLIESEFGLTIQHVRGRGYRLVRPIDWLDAATIRARSGGRWEVEVAERVDSTNTRLLARSSSHAGPLALFAEHQMAGRGRRGRQWHTRLGEALTFSVLWQVDGGVARLSGLSLAVGLAIVRALAGFGLQVALKWPNDVLLQGRKLAGILVELAGDTLGPTSVVIGVGINLQSPEVDQPTAGVRDIRPELSRNELAGALLTELAQVLDEFAQGGFAGLRQDWQQHHLWQDQPVELIHADGLRITGIARGVDSLGALLLETSDGVQRFHSGDVSLRSRA